MTAVARDHSGNGRHGTFVNDPLPVAPAPNGGNAARFFDGTSYVTLDAVIPALPAHGFAFGCWMRPIADYADEEFGAGVLAFNTRSGTTGPYGGTSNRFMIRYGGTRNPQLLYADNGDGAGFPDIEGVPIALNEWAFVGCNFDRTFELFVNGVSFGTATMLASNDLQSTDRFSAGQEWDDNTPSDRFLGIIDEVFAVPRKLTAAEWLALYEADAFRSAILALDPAGYWPFDGGGFHIGAVVMG